jgi:hypothetical protein
MSMQDLIDKTRRETMRWLLLVSLHIASPEGMTLVTLKAIIVANFADATDAELKRNLDYLHERELIHLKTMPDGTLFAKIDRYGFDIVERTVDCDPGIARPRLGAT